MKKKYAYLLLIVIAIVGSKLLYGINYDLNSEMEVSDNLYRFDLPENKEVVALNMEDNYLYYVLLNTTNSFHYSLVKYDLSNNRIINTYDFNSNEELDSQEIIIKNKEIYLTSLHSNIVYVLNKKLDLLRKEEMIKDYNDTYGIYNNKLFTVKLNTITYNNKLTYEINNTCGVNYEILYRNNTYLRFYNYDKNLGCLYNLDNKSLYYLDYDNIDIAKDKYLEYKTDSIKFRYNSSDYYFNDISESYNLKLHSNSDYLFTYDSTNYYLRIYSLSSRKTIYEVLVPSFKGATISNVKIDNYAYFTVNSDNINYIYVWDYLNDIHVNKDMISHDEKEYKFKNDKIISDIKEKYNIDIYVYDQSIKYFNDLYVIPTYDDVLINTRLGTLVKVLESFNNDHFNNYHLSIYFEKDIMTKNNDKVETETINKNKEHAIIINIVNDNFKDNIINELNKIINKNK